MAKKTSDLTLKIIVLPFIISTTLVSCMSHGAKINPVDVKKIQKGKTTRSQLISMFGQPTASHLNPGGTENLHWWSWNTQIKPQAMIPLLGHHLGGQETTHKQLQVILGSNKVVRDYSWNTPKMSSRFGSR